MTWLVTASCTSRIVSSVSADGSSFSCGFRCGVRQCAVRRNDLTVVANGSPTVSAIDDWTHTGLAGGRHADDRIGRRLVDLRDRSGVEAVMNAVVHIVVHRLGDFLIDSRFTTMLHILARLDVLLGLVAI